MIKEELIKILETFPNETTVVILDSRKAAFSSDGFGTSAGIEEEFQVNEVEVGKIIDGENTGEMTKIICLTFQNEDYTTDGGANLDSDLYHSILRTVGLVGI